VARELVVPSTALGADVHVTLHGPDDAPDSRPLPLLVVHDGPALDDGGRLTAHLARPLPHRVALLDPGEREQWYSASALYARALTTRVLPAIANAVAVERPVGLGASLGALSLLHAQRRFAHAFAGLFLQSGSFFMPRYDRHESGFARYQRIVRFVRATVRDPPPRLPIVLTASREEENVHNNRVMARALGTRLVETGGAHDVRTWHAAWAPHLTQLLQDVWSRP
jgi:enterochelin esterase family protein